VKGVIIMAQLIFSEQNMIEGNIFKYEQRLKTHLNKYTDNGAILTTYYSQNENESTVDRGLQTIDELFGNKSPLRFNKIDNLPLYGFGQANPDNTDEMQIEDINVEGDCQILPATIVPKPHDVFMINHLKMVALFEVTSVTYDSMKVEGFYKIHYRLLSTNEETIDKLNNQVVQKYQTDLNAVGSNINPIIQEDDYFYRVQVERMINSMISSYRALFYNQRHNCFLYHNPDTGEDWFDMCGNEFIAKHSLMNPSNATKVIVLHEKIRDSQFPLYYNNSVYNWLEIGAPARLLQKFHFLLNYSDGYPDSSFYQWGDDVQIMTPIDNSQSKINFQEHSFFDSEQLRAFSEGLEPSASEYDALIWKYIHKVHTLSIRDVSLTTGDALLSSIRHIDVYLYTPIIIYIIRQILQMN
jgi:hypothetical protein